MNGLHEVRMPHFGEGMRYAKVVNILKKVGEPIEEDSNILVVETDKTSIEITSPVSGIVSEILCKESDVIDVGEVMLTIRQNVQAAPNGGMRTFQQKRRGEMDMALNGRLAVFPPDTAENLPEKQVQLIDAMQKSRQQVVLSSLGSRIDWGALQDARKQARSALDAADVPSSLEMICWSVAQAMFRFPKFRAKIIDNNRLSYTAETCIGLAVEGEEDTLSVPTIVLKADSCFADMRGEIRRILRKDAGTPGPHSLVISDMSSLDVLSGQPVVIAPAIATLFIGAPYWDIHPGRQDGYCKYCNLVLGFDHRVINGAYGARFLKQVRKNLDCLIKQPPFSLAEKTRNQQTRKEEKCLCAV